MKKYIYIIVFLISSLAFGQKQNEIGCTKHLAISAKTNFENDVKNNTVTIYLQGGIVSVIKKEDLAFQEKYGIRYHDSGCVATKNLDYYKMYNYHAFAYLSGKFGEHWKRELNSNAFGIK
jgi:hypothetical protein